MLSYYGLLTAYCILQTNRKFGMKFFTFTTNNTVEGGTITPKMKKFHLRTGKREAFKNYEMKYPQWNQIPGTHVKVKIDENGKILEYDVNKAFTL